MKSKKLWLVALLVALIAAFFAFDLGRFFSLAYIKGAQAGFATLYGERPLTVAGVFFAVYVFVFVIVVFIPVLFFFKIPIRNFLRTTKNKRIVFFYILAMNINYCV